ncbi:CRISPR system Cascade subunit CasC [Crossiella equi]|uniref:CRISPR system Cascade subunit CasC n=1 Tax=Crossiella equi TaxID=130796 RepID=A0ABS5ASZ2_9PSEU|nr:type I-E CRISPR-associated protein Cas7/Cse4/CasC [Crossiella equi]MBP2479696.1 CRISPR system Cascade subunit CasC [Crossiella equi]
MIIELHLLQSFPVSNLNRDDLGQPKTASVGGHLRARISSQSLKRAARKLFTEYGLDKSEVGVRTKRLLTQVENQLADQGRDRDEARGVVIAALEQLGFGVDSAKGLTEYLLFVSTETIDRLAELCTQNWDSLSAFASAKSGAKQAKAKLDKAAQAEVKRVLDASRATDIALFGRMIADNKDLNVDAASQVAHAISTHVAVTEFDYFTAVDDFLPTEESGADMIGTVDFNSACYYRYANINLEQLARNLDNDRDLVRRAAKAWLYAFINAVPGGKQNSTAARTMPDTLLGVARPHGAWNLSNAFLNPVSADDLMAESTTRLIDHFTKLRSFYGKSNIASAVAASVSRDLAPADGLAIADNVDDFVEAVLTGAAA